MTLYLDTSVCVSLFVDDVHTPRVKACFRSDPPVAVSRWTMAEFSSALARLRNAAAIDGHQHQGAELRFDQWTTLLGPPISLTDMDMIYVRDLCRDNGSVREPDAIHIVLARRLDLPLVSLDNEQCDAARRERLKVIAP